MKKAKLNFLFVFIFFISLAVNSYAEGKDKTFAIGVNPLGYLVLGPSVYAEFSGLGAVGIYGAYQHVGGGVWVEQVEEDDDVKLSGYTIEAGVKYYVNYATKFHDSFYIGAGYTNMLIKGEEVDDSDNNVEVKGHSANVFVGWRWQWPLLFLDLSVGGTYTKVDATVSRYYDEDDADDLESSLDGPGASIKFIVGVAF